MSEVVPPNNELKLANHHWLEVWDSDGHFFEFVVLQWNPVAKRWSHSGNVATGLYVNTEGWRYSCKCPLPSEEQFL